MNVLLAILVFQLIVAAMIGASLEANDGRWVYPIDDVYSALAASRNLAETGVHGLNRGVFSGASPAPLYTVLLAGIFKLTKSRELVPLVVNLIAASAVLGAASSLLTRLGAGPWRSLAALLALVVATPLPTLALTGMEHTLHILSSLLFVSAFLAKSRLLPVAAMLMTGMQYDGFVLVAIALAILAHRREWTSAVRTLAGSMVVPAAVAFASWSNGWPLIPASLVLNATLKHPDAWMRLLDPAGFKAIRNLIGAPHLLALLTALFAGFRTGRSAAAAAVAAILIHAQFGATGWLNRYEAYVVAIGIITIAILPSARIVAVAVLLCLVLGWRAQQSVVAGIGGSASVFAQHYQLGQFFRDHYPGKPVAVNNAGAVSFLRPGSPVIDLSGSGHREILESIRRNEAVSGGEIGDIVRRENVEVAAVIGGWSDGAIPKHWVRAGAWQVNARYLGGGSQVTFYGTSQAHAGVLRSQLARYRPRLPERVIVVP